MIKCWYIWMILGTFKCYNSYLQELSNINIFGSLLLGNHSFPLVLTNAQYLFMQLQWKHIESIALWECKGQNIWMQRTERTGNAKDRTSDGPTSHRFFWYILLQIQIQIQIKIKIKINTNDRTYHGPTSYCSLPQLEIFIDKCYKYKYIKEIFKN